MANEQKNRGHGHGKRGKRNRGNVQKGKASNSHNKDR